MKDIPRFPTYGLLWGPAKGAEAKEDTWRSGAVCDLGARGDIPPPILVLVFNSASHPTQGFGVLSALGCFKSLMEKPWLTLNLRSSFLILSSARIMCDQPLPAGEGF